MLVKILGGIDFICGIILIFGIKYMPVYILVPLGIILIIKSGLGLLKDFTSWIDFLSGVCFILSIFFSVPTIICIIIGILILQKGIFSFL